MIKTFLDRVFKLVCSVRSNKEQDDAIDGGGKTSHIGEELSEAIDCVCFLEKVG